VIAKSFERIHRSNLVGMGIIPLCFKAGEDADSLGLTGHERYSIDLPANLSEIRPGQDVTVTTDNGKSFTCTLRFDTEVYAFQKTSFNLSSSYAICNVIELINHKFLVRYRWSWRTSTMEASSPMSSATWLVRRTKADHTPFHPQRQCRLHLPRASDLVQCRDFAMPLEGLCDAFGGSFVDSAP